MDDEVIIAKRSKKFEEQLKSMDKFLDALILQSKELYKAS